MEGSGVYSPEGKAIAGWREVFMKNVLVIGAGRFGRYTCEKLNGIGCQVLLIDRNEKRLAKALTYVTCSLIGDSTERDFMATIGVSNFDFCVVAIGDDFLSSLETTFLLKELGAKRVISRATSGSQEKFLLRNGADSVVFPERQLGTWTAIRYSYDNISNYFELMDGYASFELDTPDSWDGCRIADLDVRKKYGFNILGVKNGRMNMEINGDTILRRGQHLLVLGNEQLIRKRFKL